MNIEHKIVGFNLKSATSGGKKWDGHANAFFTIDSAQEIVVPGAFTDTIPQFLENGFIGGLNHNWDDPIGKPLAAKEDSVGLWIDALCDVDSNEARKCADLIHKKIIKKLSIGYRVKGDEYLETAEDVAKFWNDAGYTPTPQDVAMSQYGARLLTKLHLFETSPVTVPANLLSDIERVKRYGADEITTERQFEKFLRDAGFARDACKTICVSGFKALRQRDVEEAVTTSEASPPPAEPDPPTAETATEETVEAKTEAEPIIEVRPPVVVIDVSKGAHQQQVQSLYANLLDIKARYGLGAP